MIIAKKYIASFLYALSLAYSIVLIHINSVGISPIIFIFASSVFAIVLFNFFSYRNLKRIYISAFKNLKSVIIINLIIAIQWMAAFYGAKYAAPFKYLAVSFIVPTIFSNTMLLASNKKQCFYLLANIGLCILIILSMNSSIGIICAVSAGCLSYIYRKYTYNIMIKEILSQSDILCLRNYGLLIVSAIGFLIYKHYFNVVSPPLLALISIPLIGFVLSIYLNQLGIRKSGAEKHSVIASATPIFSVIISLLIGVQDMSKFSIYIAFAMGAILIFESYHSLSRRPIRHKPSR